MFLTLVPARFIFIVIESCQPESFNSYLAIHESGELAWMLLIFTIYIGLLHKLLPSVWIIRNLLPLRKHVGAMIILIVTAHISFLLNKNGIFTNIHAISSLLVSRERAIIFGTLSFTILLFMLFSSSKVVINQIGYRAWKRIQQLAHVAFIFAALHIGLSSYLSDRSIHYEPFIYLGIYVLGYMYLWWKNSYTN